MFKMKILTYLLNFVKNFGRFEKEMEKKKKKTGYRNMSVLKVNVKKMMRLTFCFKTF